MKPGRTCGICASPELSLKYDGLLASGLSLIEISRELGVSKYTVSRHGRHSALKLSDDDATKLPVDRLDLLFDRCENLFNALASAGDPKAAANVLAIQARLAQAAVAREEAKQQETEADANDPLKPPSPAYMTWIKDQVHSVYQRWVNERGWIWCPCCGHIPIDPATASQQIKAYMESHDANSSAVAN